MEQVYEFIAPGVHRHPIPPSRRSRVVLIRAASRRPTAHWPEPRNGSSLVTASSARTALSGGTPTRGARLWSRCRRAGPPRSLFIRRHPARSDQGCGCRPPTPSSWFPIWERCSWCPLPDRHRPPFLLESAGGSPAFEIATPSPHRNRCFNERGYPSAGECRILQQ